MPLVLNPSGTIQTMPIIRVIKLLEQKYSPRQSRTSHPVAYTPTEERGCRWLPRTTKQKQHRHNVYRHRMENEPGYREKQNAKARARYWHIKDNDPEKYLEMRAKARARPISPEARKRKTKQQAEYYARKVVSDPEWYKARKAMDRERKRRATAKAMEVTA